VSAVRSGRWKLLQYHETGSVELYDLQSDPGESRNLASGRVDVRTRLKDRLQDWLREVDAQMPLPNPAVKE